MRGLEATLRVAVTGLAPIGVATLGVASLVVSEASAASPEHSAPSPEHASPEKKSRTLVVSVDRLPQRTILDAGSISVGNSLQLSVVLRSDLGQPLSIRSVSSDCGCLKVEQVPRESGREESQPDEPKRGKSPPADSPAGEPAALRIQLAPSHKLGRIRRNIRVVFDQAPTLPLDLGLDTRIDGPVEFGCRSVSIESQGDAIAISGTKRDNGIDMLECEALRGCCEVLGLEQTDDRFLLRVRPLVAFGSAQELFRIRYRGSKVKEPTFVDLPLELRSISPLRFFPSIAPVRFEEGAWRSAAKLVLSPDTGVDVDQLIISIEREDQTVMEPNRYRVNLLQSSIVLYSVHVECFAADDESNRPARLRIADSHHQHLATLHFSKP